MYNSYKLKHPTFFLKKILITFEKDHNLANPYMKQNTKSVCEQDTYKGLYNLHYSTLRNFLYYKCGDMQMAEDLAQDAFIKLWNNCAKVIFEKARSYLFTVAKNEFLNTVNHKKIVLQHQSQASKNKTFNETPQFLLEEQEFLIKLKNAIADLPEKQREVFLLSRIDKKKYSEISEIVGVSVKAVEKRMSLALIELRKKIGNI